MAFTSYTTLQEAVASWLHRSDLTTEIKDFITLAEADMQVRAKLSQWDTSASVTITAGVGPLPSDFAHAKSAVYGSQTGTLQFLSGERFENYIAAYPSGEPLVFRINGSNIEIAPAATGTLALEYTARFTPLSDSATSNSLLTLFPDAYLNGTLMHACSWAHDTENMAKYTGMFEASIRRIRTYMLDYMYPNGLQMRAS